MTCIVGVIRNGKVTLGGDSAGVGGYSLRVRKDAKVFVKDDMVIGYTSSFRMGQLLQYSLKVPFHRPTVDTYEYMATEVINAIRQCFKDGGYARKKEEEETGGTFLIGYKGRIFEIEDDYQVAEISADFNAVGCGASYALGALAVLDHPSATADSVVTKALEIAEMFSAGVRRPFIILTEPEECADAK